MRVSLLAAVLTACGPAAFHHATPDPRAAFSRDAPRATTWSLELDHTTARVERYLKAGQPVLAMRACSEAREPTRALEVACGLAALLLGDRRAAEARWERAARAGSHAAWLDLAALGIEERDWARALLAADAALAQMPHSYEGLRARGAALRGSGRYAEAASALELAVEAAPERPEAYFDLGVLHALYLGDRTVARSWLNRFVVLAGSRPEYAAALHATTRRCRPTRRRTERRLRCVPGYGWSPPEVILTLSDIEEMQRMAAEMEAANEAAALERADAGP